ncbi:Ecp9-3 [Fulvia fulva]|uniref:Ecp9-3 n=1 Tax=Passalora fulva TaxID=5499 RepID=A0A1P8YXQ1_PASFU|nr:Ecp9-3 [Fulvia fulva]AQA29286.1 extracellular protein 9-3 [Fulvia fulva]KAK4632163.1 Ecp9-3 [Fulvia fulva]KAK4633161.1 Ecp9-3 [Fulvia fulva]UJO13402.1 Ecp9-3 [Fulvia fulva]WPV10673.1 Ecp9-3 [Fulvia fulva]
MKLLPILLITIIAVTANPQSWDDDQRPPCDHGAAGDGSCEKDGLHTYCCSYDSAYRHLFPVNRPLVRLARGPSGDYSRCGPEGVWNLFCAEMYLSERPLSLR